MQDRCTGPLPSLWRCESHDAQTTIPRRRASRCLGWKPKAVGESRLPANGSDLCRSPGKPPMAEPSYSSPDRATEQGWLTPSAPHIPKRTLSCCRMGKLCHATRTQPAALRSQGKVYLGWLPLSSLNCSRLHPLPIFSSPNIRPGLASEHALTFVEHSSQTTTNNHQQQATPTTSNPNQQEPALRNVGLPTPLLQMRLHARHQHLVLPLPAQSVHRLRLSGRPSV